MSEKIYILLECCIHTYSKEPYFKIAQKGTLQYLIDNIGTLTRRASERNEGRFWRFELAQEIEVLDAKRYHDTPVQLCLFAYDPKCEDILVREIQR